jgi:hypothetical protein
MFVVTTRRSATRPRVWLWALGTLVLPMMVLVGFGPGMDHVIRSDPEVVEVVIHPNRLAIPRSVPAGTIVFDVINRDTVTHGLAVRKEGGGAPIGHLEMPVRPGATGRVLFKLEPGDYHVYCPNGVHRGLIRRLTVTPRTTGPGS